MTEETTEPTPEPAQTRVKDSIEIMIKALELAEIAFSYKNAKGSNPGIIFIDQGRKPVENRTLSQYIKKAEEEYAKRHNLEILKDAMALLKAELDAVRELLK